MKLSIITINYNDAAGLKKTLTSVVSQESLWDSSTKGQVLELEHIIIDGGSTDGSVDIIRNYEKQLSLPLRLSLKWISEKDAGIYNAMNKGIRMATGDYIQILNSGDILASNAVVEQMLGALEEKKYPEILYGNMLKTEDGVHVNKDKAGRYNGSPDSFLYFYRGTMNHDTAWIRRDLFDRFGLYDENMRICSDWKWYVDAVAIGGVRPIYVNIDVSVFDMNGISESGGKNKRIIQEERRSYLEKILPASVLHDYDAYCFPINQYRRLKQYHIWGLVHFLERVLFKLEKWGVLK